MQIFPNVDSRVDEGWIVKEFFNYISEEDFVGCLSSIVNRDGCVLDEEYCLFPDLSPDGDFVGVKVGTFGNERIYSEAEFLVFLRAACGRYSEKHPEATVVISGLLSSMPCDASPGGLRSSCEF